MPWRKLVEHGDAALEERAAIDRRLDPMRSSVEEANPTACSMSAIALEMEGWEIASSAAAFPMLPDFATASRMCRSRNLSRRPDAVRPLHGDPHS